MADFVVDEHGIVEIDDDEDEDGGVGDADAVAGAGAGLGKRKHVRAIRPPSLPATVVARIDAYLPPDGFHLRELPADKTKRSIMHTYGRVIVSNIDRSSSKYKCVATDECEKKEPFALSKGGTSNATAHLKDAHGIQSDKGTVQELQLQGKKARKEEPTNARAKKEMVTEDVYNQLQAARVTF